MTNTVPINPRAIPIHWTSVTLSFNIGPLKIFVRIGCKPTIRADNVADKPIEYEKKHHQDKNHEIIYLCQ